MFEQKHIFIKPLSILLHRKFNFLIHHSSVCILLFNIAYFVNFVFIKLNKRKIFL